MLKIVIILNKIKWAEINNDDAYIQTPTKWVFFLLSLMCLSIHLDLINPNILNISLD